MLRFAPSPTGDMHIGNLRVAILNYIVSKQKDEDFLIRIEDTDINRNIAGKDYDIRLICEKFSLTHNEMYYQSEHLNIHQELAIKLLKDKKAFICKCSDEELAIEKERCKKKRIAYRYNGVCEKLSEEDIKDIKKSDINFTIRLKKPTKSIINEDLIKGNISTAPNEIDSFIILKNDKKPTYNFACACDDMLSNISMIIRGEDHLTNTPKQMHIHKSLNYNSKIIYAHLPIILNEDKKKMSKRNSSSSVKELLKSGFIPDAIINYLILIGNGKIKKEIFNLNEAIALFNLKDISKKSPQFDIDKLKFINREHIKLIDNLELSKLFNFSDINIGKLAKLYLEEADTINELNEKILSIFKPKDLDVKWSENMKVIAKIIFNNKTYETLEELKINITKESNLKGKNLFKPLRILLTGKENGPELNKIYPLIKSYLLKIIILK